MTVLYLNYILLIFHLEDAYSKKKFIFKTTSSEYYIRKIQLTHTNYSAPRAFFFSEEKTIKTKINTHKWKHSCTVHFFMLIYLPLPAQILIVHSYFSIPKLVTNIKVFPKFFFTLPSSKLDSYQRIF